MMEQPFLSEFLVWRPRSPWLVNPTGPRIDFKSTMDLKWNPKSVLKRGQKSPLWIFIKQNKKTLSQFFSTIILWYVFAGMYLSWQFSPWTPPLNFEPQIPEKSLPPKDQEITVRKLNLIWMFLSGLQNKNWKHSYKIIVQNLILRAKHKKKPLT